MGYIIAALADNKGSISHTTALKNWAITEPANVYYNHTTATFFLRYGTQEMALNIEDIDSVGGGAPDPDPAVLTAQIIACMPSLADGATLATQTTLVDVKETLGTISTSVGGVSVTRIKCVGVTTNPNVLKASAGTFYGLNAANVAAAVKYIKMYDKDTSPVVASDVPVMTIAIPVTATAGSYNLHLPHGVTFSTGIALVMVGGITDTDATALTAGDIFASFFWS